MATTGSNAILLGTNAPLFVDAARGNFYLAAGSQAIDSSLNRLDDRPAMVAVTSPLGIPPAPVVAPDQDRFGQLRIDDPLQAPPPGLGSNIFKDRGAVERADFEGPYAVLMLPKDNDAADRSGSRPGNGAGGRSCGVRVRRSRSMTTGLVWMIARSSRATSR